MNAADLVAEIEAIIPSYDGFHGAHAQTGDEYRQFSLRGDDEADLCARMRDLIVMYVNGSRRDGSRLFWRYAEGRIFWRPLEFDNAPFGRLQTRLVVTAAPVRWFSWSEYDESRRVQLERKMLGKKLDS